MSEPRKYTGKLSGQTVLIIGGTSGIGYGVAEALLEHGSRVLVSSSSAQKVADTLKRLEAAYPTSAPGRIWGQACNLQGDDAEAQVAALFSGALAWSGGSGGGEPLLDHVIFTAGSPLSVRKLTEWSAAEMRSAGDVRFFGPLLVARQIAKGSVLKTGPASSFVITTGTVVERPIPDWAVIGSFAAGTEGMARQFALDLAPIRVNAVMPGPVDTELWDGMRAAGKWAEMQDQFKQRLCTGVIGQVEDVVEAYLYLLKDKNVTGSTVRTDGGSLLK